MNIRDFFKHYVFSPLGLLVLALSLGGALTAAVLASLWLAILIFPLSYLMLSLPLMVSGFGARSIVREQGRSRWTQQAETLPDLLAAAKRLAAFRLSDPDLKRLAGRLGMATQEYVAACQKARSIDPVASHAVLESLEILDAWLEDHDSLAKNRHFGPLIDSSVPTAATPTDAAMIEAEPNETVTQRALGLLAACLDRVEKASLELSGGLSAADKLAIKEELK